MESDYDRKFEEMKGYIPFLERMITRLDIGDTPKNPRQAQLDKIRSLRDLLQNKKKRMKMENLLKCEQVLITLHAKVEQRDGVTEKRELKKKTEASDLNVVRNKLKSVVSRLNPEVDRDGDITEVEFKRNTEPAEKFQRRPNQKTILPIRGLINDDKNCLPQSSKRNYTRVLHSPEKSSRLWPESSKTDLPLFSCRSPRKTSHRYSPSYKKEKKKSKNSKQTKLRDLNITLNVPEEKLNSLDTDDIITRIINCSDSDVDIATLRELRSEILGELKHTGVKDDISELLLKSCKTNTKNKIAMATEIEEGELSDSESEAIENIYGSLVITNKDTSTSTVINAEKDKSRKIQICLVINSDKNEQDSSKQEVNENKNATIVDNSEFQSFSQTNVNLKVNNSLEIDENEHGVLDGISKTLNSCLLNKLQNNKQECEAMLLDGKPIDKDKKVADREIPEKVIEVDAFSSKETHSTYEKSIKDGKATEKRVLLNTERKTETLPDIKGVEESKVKSFVPNFYKSNIVNEASELGSVVKSSTCQENVDVQINNLGNERETVKHVNIIRKLNTKSSVEIPLLDFEATNKKDIVSEIDILQALKKEILGETTIEPITSTDDTNTPALHQPKITKVARAQEIVKKTISIENYKQKCNEPTKPWFFRDVSQKSSKEDHNKKQSLKLTEKECERFKLPIELPLNDSSEDDDDLMESLNVYSDLAPKSPDHEDFADLGIKPPVIIPSDPVKPIVINSFLDVDMRNVDDFSYKSKEVSADLNIVTEKHLKLSNPRRTNSRWKIPQSDETSMTEEKVVLPGISLDSQQPSMTPSRNTSGSHMTPSRLTATSVTQPTSIASDISSKFMPMTPNARTYEMTPPCVDSEDISGSKHVYDPMFSGGNKGDRNEQRNSESYIWEMNTMLKDIEFDSRDSFGRYQRPHTPIQSFARHEGKTTHIPSFGRIDCPTTPLPLFGRRECSITPLPSSFGRNERAMTPVNSFTSMDGSRTPVHSYGRTDEAARCTYPYNISERLIPPGHSFSQFDGSSTPIYAYGRADVPTTPAHPFGQEASQLDITSYSFGRSDDPGTPTHSYGGHDGSGTRANLFGQDGSGTPGITNYSEGCTTPSHSFGRTDYMRQYQLTKPIHGRNDPRLNRSFDFDNYKKREDNREYGFYNEQKYNPEYGSDRRGPDDFRKYKQHFGRNDMNRPHDRKNEGYFKDVVSGKDKFDKRYFNSKETLSYRDKKEYQFYNDRYNLREHSAEINFSNHRGPCNTYENDSDLDGRLFNKDRSENTSLQNIEKSKKSLSSFDNRRRAPSVGRLNHFDNRLQRASSVGSVFIRERSLDQTTHDIKQTTNKSDIVSKRKDRASSVGKELHIPRPESFKNIKDDLRLFKIKNDHNIEKRFGATSNVKKISSRNKSDISKFDFNLPFQKTQSINRRSPRNNYQNLKWRRDLKLQYKDKHKNKSQFRYHKKPGIIYSDANISKGTILGPGCGVKNYKIPKIKRPLEIESDNVTDNIKEKISEEVRDRNSTNWSDIRIERIDSDKQNLNTDTGDNDAINDKKVKANLDINNTETKYEESNQNVLKLSSNRRITRSSVISTSSTDSLNEEVIVKRTKKCKTKQIIYDETESENEEKVQSYDTVQSDALRVSKSLEHNPLESSDLPCKAINLGDNAPTQKFTHNKELNFNNLDRNNEMDKKDFLSTEELNINKEKANTKKIEHSDKYNVTPDISLPAAELNIPSSISDSTFNLQHLNPVNEIKKNINQEVVSTVKEIISKQHVINNTGNESVNSSFGDLEIFSDIIATDPVLDNINALIADLDHDINTVKSNSVRRSFKQDFLLDHMFDSIKENRYMDGEKISVENNLDSSSKVSQDQNTDERTKTLAADIDKSCKNEMSCKNEIVPEKKNVTIAKLDVISKVTSISSKLEIKPSECVPKNIDVDNNSSDAIVSTTKDDIKLFSHEQNTSTESHASSTSRPDSTNNVVVQHKITNAIAPDSTNESNECNDLISSSNSEAQSATLTVDSSQSIDKSDSIGNFLSILQDKTKIRELLSILGEQSSDNEKIKKKLEKLSAIVSDDEDDINDDCNITKLSSGNTNEVIQSNNEVVESKSTAHLDKFALINTPDGTGDLNVLHGHKSDKLDSFVEVIKHNDDNTEGANSNEKEVCNNINKNTSPHGETETECARSTKVTKKGRGKKIVKGGISAKKRFTRSVAVAKTKTNKPSRELLNLQADIREMFLKDDEDILGGTTGLRMCRLAKLVGEKSQSQLREESLKNDTMEKLKNSEDSIIEKTPKRKYTRKIKSDRYNKINEDSLSPVNKETASEKDPYLFEIESVNESISTAEKREHSPENDSNSAKSPHREFSERLFSELKKKPKRKRSAWKSGIILTKNKKKKLINTKPKITAVFENAMDGDRKTKIPNLNCYVDKLYCFSKSIPEYDCKICDETFTNIVCHYRKEHPHSEIPLSRMSPDIALEAIKQCEIIDFRAICQIPSYRYVCRFCFKEFTKSKLESFFWHIVSAHTGEYKEPCTVCEVNEKCPLALDIPPPPLKQKGQLIGYICGNCNYTQLSLENLKTHVITRHNDEQTEVYTINMSHMSVKALNSLLKQTKKITVSNESEEQRVLTRTRTCASSATNDEKSDIADEIDNASRCHESNLGISKKITKIHSKITFENDTDTSLKVKEEPKDIDEIRKSENELEQQSETYTLTPIDAPNVQITDDKETERGKDINESPHLKVTYTDSGSKLYVCCINGHPHYRTALMISFKKHIQVAHIDDKWDGYCCICKVIVMTQGLHSYRSCLDHLIDNHLDNFPVLEIPTEKPKECCAEKPMEENIKLSVTSPVLNSPKPFLSVRPISELLSNTATNEKSDQSPLVSLGNSTEPQVSYPTQEPVQDKLKGYLYEEAQAEIMSKKNIIILDAMISHDKLVQVFKCAGRFCSYTTNSAEDALLHVSTHSRIGGDNALKCAYCDFDCLDNAIDLVTHVFKYHGFCQYVCGYCFYRATASQLVNRHIARVHENVPVKTVLKSSFTTEPIEANMLSREAAVPTYVCSCDDEDGVKCKFKTYTPGKLCEHIKGRHKDVTVHECFICKAPSDSVAALVHHYKSHGLKLYQCAWCVFGADSENELLTHSSIHHAVCQPKAYLRVITNKGGTSEFRVLPLAHLNKSNLPNIKDVSPTGVRENPVREAERSIDLEKLIGHTTSFSESSAIIEKETPNEVSSDEPSIAESMLNFTPEPQSRSCTSLAVVSIDHSTPIIKSEVVTPTSPKPGTSTDVICLDSDDEVLNTSNVSRESKLSNTSSIQEPLALEISNPLDDSVKSQFRLKSLYKCATCSVISKNSAHFKSHLSKCFPNQTYHIPCAFCSFKGSKTKLLAHYTQNHLFKPKSMDRNDSLVSIGPQDKAKQQSTENPSNIVLSAKKVGGVTFRELTAKKKSKRKTSAENSLGPPVKVTKYGPDEITKLPINPIFENCIYCSLCEFTTKVRLNMVRHLQSHANQQPVPQTAPVNPVPHLETNEMHFDKMLNLASSSLANRQDKLNKNETPSIPIPLESASSYPKYVPERTRHTCGAKGCSYISVDENMLKCHWETLHSGSNDFHCVHCPPYQKLDTKTPVTASRIIAHLKMHDAKLYACSQCRFYHFKQTMVEKHINEAHNRGDVMVVREEVTSVLQVTPPVSASTAPTMDLKPWQCGLCEYKSLLRPEVVEHCAKTHNSKMQFKCVYCAFRTSNEENVSKHQSQSHQEFPAATFYFYYREGSVPNQADETPFWKIQKQNYGSCETKIKSEKVEAVSLSTTPVTNTTPPAVNLSIVKQEVVESIEENIEDLCKLFGQFCEPNGLRYKCPLCKIVIEDTKEAMQSHLYEELQYRKWSCSICFYKAFHRRGMSDHMTSEHRVNRDPVELPVDTRVETWVTGLIQHQEAHIDNCRKKLAKQKAEIMMKPQGVSEQKSLLIPQNTTVSNMTNIPSKEELENKFGALGVSKDMAFCCPKCNEVIGEECAMRNHLESELNKIRWCCSTCPKTFTSYHQAQFHCKTHSGQPSRPVEAPRDSAVRTAWVDAVLEVQKLSMNCAPPSVEQQLRSISPDPSDNSLLVVRYEERVPMTENQSTYSRESPDSDVDRLVITEIKQRKRKANTSCKYCDFSSTKKKILNEHILQIHYDLKPFMCEYCKVTGTISYLKRHQKVYHAMKPINIIPTQVPTESPSVWVKRKLDVPSIGIICLTCQSPVLQSEIPDHVHENAETEFGRIGEVIIKCSTCSTLHKDIHKFEEHKKKTHSNDGNYVFYKLTNRRVQAKCSYCPQKFTLKKDLKAHTEASHSEQMKYATLEPQSSKVIVLDDEKTIGEVLLSPRKRVARKSTSKLPFFKAVARKSTSKLPMEYEEEYSYYGTKPCLDRLENVTTMMPFYNSYMPVTFERLTGVLNIDPKVVITKLPNEILK